MLLNILQCTGQPPRTKSYPAKNGNSAKVEKPCFKQRSDMSDFFFSVSERQIGNCSKSWGIAL